jgi:hypothetical protein
MNKPARSPPFSEEEKQRAEPEEKIQRDRSVCEPVPPLLPPPDETDSNDDPSSSHYKDKPEDRKPSNQEPIAFETDVRDSHSGDNEDDDRVDDEEDHVDGQRPR